MSNEGDKIRTGVTPKPTAESKLVIESLDGVHRLRPTSEAPAAQEPPTAEPAEGEGK